MLVLELLGIFVIGYLIGSIPTGYLVVKKRANVDIREVGSGRIGGYNAFSVTKSKTTGILVGVLDALKGLVVVYGAMLISHDSFSAQAVALFGAIAGQTYPAWLRLKGGRGLATTAGGLFLLGFSYTVVWCVLWLLGRLFRRDILTSNLIAILFTPAIVGVLPWRWIGQLNVRSVDVGIFVFFACFLSLQLLLAHFDVVLEVWKHSKADNL
jgi:glycerol-3-phosphate acyltransferase PlsY